LFKDILLGLIVRCAACFPYVNAARISTPLKELDKMCSKYNRFLLSTCIQILAFGAFTAIPAHAEFRWTPPDETGYVEDAGPDVIMMDDNASNDAVSGSTLPEYYDTPRTESNQAIEVDPPIEIKILEEDTDQSETKSVEVKTITLSNEPTSSSLVLNPYPLEKDTIPPADNQNTDIQVPIPPATSKENTADIKWSNDIAYDVIEGFGIEMPIALALRQIVPPEYAYSFSKDVNPGARMSWEGGKPWNEVLGDALTPIGIKAFIHGKRVILRTDSSQITHSEQTATVPAEQKKNEPPEPKIKPTEKELKKSAEEITVAPEQAMNAALAKEAQSAEVPDLVSESIILDKTNVSSEKTNSNDESSSLVEDLMKTLDSYEENENTTAEPEINNIIETQAVEPSFKPEIILDEQEKAEEEYAKKLEETNPFEDTEPMELAPILDNSPAMSTEATDAPVLLPLNDKEASVSSEQPKTNTEVEKEHTISSMEAIEPKSHFREEPSNKIHIWQAKRNSNLQKIIEEWSAKERVDLTWNTTEKYVLDCDVFISGTYESAIDILFKKGLKQAPEYTLSNSPYSLSIQEKED